MKTLYFATLLLLAGSTSAAAADMAQPAVYNWDGIYGGVHGGYLWGDVDLAENGVAGPGGKIDGFVGGPLAGINFQSDSLVFGLEADFAFSDADGQGVAVSPDYAYDLDWDGHVRGRLGFAADDVLFFAAGGLALANFRVNEIGSPITVDKTYTGFTVGGGIDYGFSPNLIGRVEYLHDEYGKEHYTIGVDSYTTDLTNDTVRAAVIYKF